MDLKRISTAELENELLDRHRKERLSHFQNESEEEERIFESYFSKFEVKRMTIQDAIKSGKPFYRPIWAEEYDGFQPTYDIFDSDMNTELPGLTVGDILANDWKTVSGKEPGDI